MLASVYRDAICLPKPQITLLWKWYILKVLCDLTLLVLVLQYVFEFANKEKNILLRVVSEKER